MNKSECIKFVGNMTIAYPNFFKIDDENKVKATVELWFEMMEDIPYNIASLALKKHIANQKYPPSISEIRNAVLEITTPSEKVKSSYEAWSYVMRVVRNNSYNYSPKKCKDEIKTLGTKIEACVEYIGYGQLWNCDLIRDMPFIEKRFKEYYDSLQDKELRHDKLPESLQKAIAGIAGDADVQKKLC